MAFEFPLATVLRYRESIEKQEERALGIIVAELAQVWSRIDDLAQQIETARQTLEQAMRQTLPAIEVSMMAHQIEGMVQRRQELIDSATELEHQRQAQNQKYQVAYSSRRMLSDMQDRQREAYEQERVRAEQKLLDGLYASRAQRG